MATNGSAQTAAMKALLRNCTQLFDGLRLTRDQVDAVIQMATWSLSVVPETKKRYRHRALALSLPLPMRLAEPLSEVRANAAEQAPHCG
jgi:hypothetical protein